MTESPSWKKPSDVMKLRMKRRSLSRSRSFDSQENKVATKSPQPISPSLAVKRRNPFQSTQNNEKKVALEKSFSAPALQESKPESASILFEALDAKKKDVSRDFTWEWKGCKSCSLSI